MRADESLRSSKQHYPTRPGACVGMEEQCYPHRGKGYAPRDTAECSALWFAARLAENTFYMEPIIGTRALSCGFL